MMGDPEYRYLGDRNSDATFKGITCTAVRRADGKCVRGKNGSMLVQDADGIRMVVTGKLLRRLKTAGE